MNIENVSTLFDRHYKSVYAQCLEKSATQKGGIDRLTDGLKVGLNLIGGRPGMGCSTLAVSMAMNLAQKDRRVLYCSHPQHQIGKIVVRYCSSMSSIDFFITNPSKEDKKLINESIEFSKKMHQTCIFGDMTNFNNFSMLELLKELKDLRLEYLFIDCIQDIIVDSKITNGLTTEEYICRELRELAFLLNIPIVAIARLNRFPEERGGVIGKIPQLGDFWGEELPAYSANVYFPFRPEYYGIYNDERTGFDIRGKMYVYVQGRPDVKEDKIELTFDYEKGIVYDEKNEPIHYVEDKENSVKRT